MSPVILGRHEVDHSRLGRSRAAASSSSLPTVSGASVALAKSSGANSSEATSSGATASRVNVGRAAALAENTLDRVSDISRQLERAIVQGEYSPGQRLPPERLLSSQFQVSRSVVREALGRLASLGLVESRQGSGTRVTAPNGRQVSLGYERLLREVPERLADLASVRLTLETSIAALAARHRRPEHLRELERLQQILHQPRKSLAAHVKADGDFHATLAEAAGNPFFSLVLAPIHDLLTESRLQTLRRYGASIAWQHHQRILEAIRAQDADEAARAMEEHLTVNSRHLSEIDEEVEAETPIPVETPNHRRKSAGKHVPR
ncbi:MAG: FadR/GntR family transcriptional regulator [Planctomycetaceae bacterium]